jgi:RNase H-like domain found in reverse transcriptase/Reverse transcriptase (RNA-dependent DNA polymerase)/Integrase zinc binding domain/Integrase core domain/Retroviral aspartyl protease
VEEISLEEIDLSRLMGGKAFTVPCSLSHNGIAIDTLALPDSGANGFAFLNTAFAIETAKFLNVKAKRLKQPIAVKGFSGKGDHVITHYIKFTLKIDGHRQVDIPFCILNLGNHDVILGAKWMAYFDVQSDLRREKLLWPETSPRTTQNVFHREIRTPRQSLMGREINPSYQRDVESRDLAFAQEDQRRTAGRRSQLDLGVIHSRSIAKDLQGMNQDILQGLRQELTKPIRRQLTSDNRRLMSADQPVLSRVDIAEISAVGFHYNLRQPENKFFVTSLYEIDRELESCGEEDTLEHWEEVRKKLPKEYLPFSDVFSQAASDKLPPSRSYDHRIHLESDHTLGYSPLWSQTTEELKATKQYLLDNLDKGFIAPSQAPFSSPILFVKKANGSLRFCIDFRKLNALTKKDRYPLPLIDETLARLNRAKVFTKLDIRQAFHRIRMDPDSEELTTFRTRYGSYKCQVLPFGLTNGPATYQRYMNDVLFEYLDVFCTAYLDDILIYSENELEHQSHVEKVLTRLRAAGLQADIKKCEFSVTKTKYLGFIVSTDGIEVDPEKVEAVINWQPPQTVKGVQSFLGFCNFYRRFIRDYGKTAAPLTRLTRKEVPFVFGPDCTTAFEELKHRLVSAPILAHYNPDKETMLETDASDGVVAGVLSQQQSDGEYHPVAYLSKTMAPAELNYPIYDKEMLAIIRSLSHWRAELQGSDSQVKILTDHKALEYFMTSKQLTSRQARWAEILSQFFFTIAYRPGRKNELADALSRKEADVESQDKVKSQIRNQALLKPEQLDPQIRKHLQDFPSPAGEINNFMESIPLINAILDKNKTAEVLAPLRAAASDGHPDLVLEDGLLLFKGKLMVPDVDDLRTHLVREAHCQVSTAHPGKNKTVTLISDRYFWKGLRAFVDQFIQNCHTCRRAHVPRDRQPGFLHPLPIPDRPWQHIAMDFKSAPKDKQGYDNILVVICRLTKKPVSIPCLKTATAKDIAQLYITNIYRHHGVPDSIVSDRGPQFISDFWKAFTSILGIQLKLSTAFHPETDGQTEIMNQYMDQRLRPFVSYYQDNWSELLPIMDYAQLTLPHDSIGMSPFELLYGYKARTSFDWQAPRNPATAREKLSQEEAQAMARRMHDAWERARTIMKESQQKKERDVNPHRREPDFQPGDKVWISTKNIKTERPSRKLDHQQMGPYEILRKEGYSYRVKLPDSMNVHPVFAPGLLRKAADNPLPGQVNEPPPVIKITADEEHEVEAILAVKKIRKILKYRASWTGHDNDPEWYPASDFKYSPHLLRDFHLQHPELPGPPRRLSEWITSWENGIDNYDELDDDTELGPSLRAGFFLQEGG